MQAELWFTAGSGIGVSLKGMQLFAIRDQDIQPVLYRRFRTSFPIDILKLSNWVEPLQPRLIGLRHESTGGNWLSRCTAWRVTLCTTSLVTSQRVFAYSLLRSGF
jgi:hypothetical protein